MRLMRENCRGRACPCPPCILKESGQGQALPLQTFIWSHPNENRNSLRRECVSCSKLKINREAYLSRRSKRSRRSKGREGCCACAVEWIDRNDVRMIEEVEE